MKFLKKLKKRRAFDEMWNLFEKPDSNTTVLGRDVMVDGNMECSGNIRISGRMAGEVRSPGMVFVERGASVKGGITCASSIINGSVDGQINVSGKVELGRSSRVKGDIIAGSLAIEREAFISGNAVSRFSQLHLFAEKRADHME
ncbi:MAG: polymer-forming cytoskeletal protein [Acidobacteriota bacterium]